MNVATFPLGIFGHRNYALYALGNTISSLGMWAQRVGVGWLSWELAHSATWVGLVSLGQFLPLIFLAPLFGGLLDRSDPKRYAIVTNSLLAAIAVVLWLVMVLHAMTIGRFRGRVLGLWGMCNVAGPGVGGAIIGGATQVLGLRGATVAGGLISSALAVWVVRQARQAPQK